MTFKKSKPNLNKLLLKFEKSMSIGGILKRYIYSLLWLMLLFRRLKRCNSRYGFDLIGYFGVKNEYQFQQFDKNLFISKSWPLKIFFERSNICFLSNHFFIKDQNQSGLLMKDFRFHHLMNETSYYKEQTTYGTLYFHHQTTIH